MKEKSKSKSKPKSKANEKSKSKDSKKSINRVKAQKTDENVNKSETSEELNKIINPQSQRKPPEIFTNPNSPKTDALKYYNPISQSPMNNIFNNMKNATNVIKCDGCYENDAVIFCEQCEKNYCNLCDEQIHVVPSYQSHIKKPVTSTQINNSNKIINKICFLHNEEIKYFCESCEEPICQECQVIGPHNNKLHKIVSIYDSFKNKLIYLNNIAKAHLVPKYQQMTQELKNLDIISNEIKNNKSILEREIRAEFSKFSDNLNSAGGKKLAIINFETNNLQKDLNNINEIINYINDIGKSESPDMLFFLLKYKQLNKAIENSLSKPINKNFEINLNDFPRDLEEKLEKINNYNQLEKLIKYKDEIIWKLLIDKLNKNSNKIDENDFKVNIETKLEIQKWAKISDKYESELQKYNLICQFCGCFLDENTVNTPCDKNVSNVKYGNGVSNEKMIMSFKPNEEIYGTKRHYFVPNREEFKFKNFNKGSSYEKNSYVEGTISG